jgi:hypothetical protein
VCAYVLTVFCQLEQISNNTLTLGAAISFFRLEVCSLSTCCVIMIGVGARSPYGTSVAEFFFYNKIFVVAYLLLCNHFCERLLCGC